MMTFRNNTEVRLAVVETTKNINFIDELEEIIVQELNSVDFDLYQSGASINVLDMQHSRGDMYKASGGAKYYVNLYSIFYEVKKDNKIVI